MLRYSERLNFTVYQYILRTSTSQKEDNCSLFLIFLLLVLDFTWNTVPTNKSWLKYWCTGVNRRLLTCHLKLHSLYLQTAAAMLTATGRISRLKKKLNSNSYTEIMLLIRHEDCSISTSASPKKGVHVFSLITMKLGGTIVEAVFFWIQRGYAPKIETETYIFPMFLMGKDSQPLISYISRWLIAWTFFGGKCLGSPG